MGAGLTLSAKQQTITTIVDIKKQKEECNRKFDAKISDEFQHPTYMKIVIYYCM